MRTDLIEKYALFFVGRRSGEKRPAPLMGCKRRCEDYYAPFEYINPSARIVLVGITPGPTQMVNANNEEAARASGRQVQQRKRIQAAKSVGAFSGEPLRSNLINQLQPLGLPQVARSD